MAFLNVFTCGISHMKHHKTATCFDISCCIIKISIQYPFNFIIYSKSHARPIDHPHFWPRIPLDIPGAVLHLQLRGSAIAAARQHVGHILPVSIRLLLAMEEPPEGYCWDGRNPSKSMGNWVRMPCSWLLRMESEWFGSWFCWMSLVGVSNVTYC